MIDTIHIFFDYFRVNPKNKLNIREYNSVNELFFFCLTDGHPIIANSVTYYSQELGVRVIFTPEGLFGSKLFVQFEVSKVLFGHNLTQINNEQLQEAILLVYGLLKDIGIEVELRSLKISRLDLFRDILIDYSMESVKQLFLKYFTKLKKSKLQDFDNFNIEFRNKHFDFLIYDKAEEMLARKKIKLNIPPNKNLIRFEIRFRNHENVLDSFEKFKIKNELDIFLNEIDFGKLELIFSDFFEQRFFKNAPNVSALNKSIISTAYYAYKKGCQMSEFFKLVGMRNAYHEKHFHAILKIFMNGTKTQKIQRKTVERKYLEQEQRYGFIKRSELEFIVTLWNKLFENKNTVLRVYSHHTQFKSVWEAEKISNLGRIFNDKKKPDCFIQSNSLRALNE